MQGFSVPPPSSRDVWRLRGPGAALENITAPCGLSADPAQDAAEHRGRGGGKDLSLEETWV